MIDFKKAKFVLSSASLEGCPKDGKKEIVLLGRSNVGKSTLVNALLGQGLAYSSKTAGKTKTLNYFLVDGSFYLVDAPGYGYTAYGTGLDKMFASMMEDYFKSGRASGALLLLDSRRKLSDDDWALLSLLQEDGVPFAIVFTKSDRAKQSEKALALKQLGETGARQVLFSPPKQGPTALRALVASFLKEQE